VQAVLAADRQLDRAWNKKDVNALEQLLGRRLFVHRLGWRL